MPMQIYRKNYIDIYFNLYGNRQQTRQKVLSWVAENIPWIQSFLNSSWIRFWFVIVIPKYLNCFHIFRISVSSLYVMFSPYVLVMRYQHMYMQSCLSTSGPSFLLESLRASLFFLMAFMLPPSRFTPSAETRSWSVIQFQSHLVFWDFPNALFKSESSEQWQ